MFYFFKIPYYALQNSREVDLKDKTMGSFTFETLEYTRDVGMCQFVVTVLVYLGIKLNLKFPLTISV